MASSSLDLGISDWDFSPGRLFKRCVVCPPSPPDCPVCPQGELCTQTSQTCSECIQRICVPIASSGETTTNNSSQTTDSGPNIGAIVGGIVGGIVVIAVAVFLIWRFWLKGRRSEYQPEYENEFQDYPETEKSTPRSGAFGSPIIRNSTHTTHSVASTSFTRASNVIPIAFIPGITGRPDGSAPPVPPVPIPTSAHGSPYVEGGDHYFMPGDLRDSAYSGFSSDGASTVGRRTLRTQSHMERESFASITPSLLRQSVASTVFNGNVAVTAQPAQRLQVGRANMVSVKGSNPSLRGEAVPEVPTIDYAKYGGQGAGPSVMVTDADDPGPAPANRTESVVISDATSHTGSITRPSTTASANQRAVSANNGLRLFPSTSSRPPSAATSPRQSVRGPPNHISSAIEEATTRASKPPIGHSSSSSPQSSVDGNPFSDSRAI